MENQNESIELLHDVFEAAKSRKKDAGKYLVKLDANQLEMFNKEDK